MPVRRVPMLGGASYQRNPTDNGYLTGVTTYQHFPDGTIHIMKENEKTVNNQKTYNWIDGGVVNNPNDNIQQAVQLKDQGDLYWNGEPGKPETGVAFYLQNLAPETVQLFHDFFLKGRWSGDVSEFNKMDHFATSSNLGTGTDFDLYA